MSAIKKIQKEIKWVSVGDIHCHPLNPRKNSKSAKIVAKAFKNTDISILLLLMRKERYLRETRDSKRCSYLALKSLMFWSLVV